MQPNAPQRDVGVLVGRFQVHELHQVHRDLIDYVSERHEKVIVVLGLAPLPVSTSNPLDFESRKQMILDAFPHVNVVYIKDVNSDEAWSTRLDTIISDLITPNQSVMLYGGRDSFIAHYTGRFDTTELLQEAFMSGTSVRKQIARSSAKASADFRAGVIWASQARFPTVYTAVDVAIMVFHPGGARSLLLGRKPNSKLLQFIGGFADPRSPNFETDARREVMEETGVEVEGLHYVASMNVDDWRYRNEPDCIRSMFFRATYQHGSPRPADDIEECRWVDLGTLRPTNLIPEHRPLLDALLNDLEGA